MARPAGAAGGAGGQHYAQEYPYQRALDKTGQEKLEKSWEKLSVNLKDKFKVRSAAKYACVRWSRVAVCCHRTRLLFHLPWPH